MRRLRAFLASLSPGALGLSLALVLALAAVIAGADEESGRNVETPVNPAPGPVLTSPPDTRPPPRVLLTAEQVADGERTARRFLAGYLPLLYGQGQLGDVRHVTRHLRRSLRLARRVAPPLRGRRPRVVGLGIQAQSSRSAVAHATVDDRVAPPYGLVFTLELRPAGWVVSDLASD